MERLEFRVVESWELFSCSVVQFSFVMRVNVLSCYRANEGLPLAPSQRGKGPHRTPLPLRGTSLGLRMIGVLNILCGWFTSVWKEVVFLQKFLKDEGKT